MSEFRTQLYGGVDGRERVPPIVVNNLNCMRGSGDAPALLSIDDATTLFHEFGHG